jgi:hypothetical protein
MTDHRSIRKIMSNDTQILEASVRSRHDGYPAPGSWRDLVEAKLN